MKPRQITYGGGYTTPYNVFSRIVIGLAFSATITINAVGAYRENEAQDPIEILGLTFPAPETMGIVSLIAGIVGAAAWIGWAAAAARRDHGTAGAALLLAILCSAFSALNTYTMRLSTSVSATELVEVQTQTATIQGAKITAAQTRVDNAKAEFDRLQAVYNQAVSDRSEEALSGKGTRWKAATDRMDGAEADLDAASASLAAAEEAQTTLLSSGDIDPEKKTAGAVVIANQSSGEKWGRIIVWVIVLEAFGLLPRILRRQEDPHDAEENSRAWAHDMLGEMQTTLSEIRRHRETPPSHTDPLHERNPIAAFASDSKRQAHEVHDEFQREFEDFEEDEPETDDVVARVRGEPDLVLPKRANIAVVK